MWQKEHTIYRSAPRSAAFEDALAAQAAAFESQGA